MKAVSVNAYIKKNGNKLVVIKTDTNETLFINEGLLAHACQNGKPMKDKDEKKA